MHPHRVSHYPNTTNHTRGLDYSFPTRGKGCVDDAAIHASARVEADRGADVVRQYAQHPDAVLLEIAMPKMDGHAALKAPSSWGAR